MKESNKGGTGTAPDRERIGARAAAQLDSMLARELQPGLHIVATPIGNLGDISLRAIAALACADVLLCEDTRRARALLTHFGISRHLEVYEEHSARRIRPQVIARLMEGSSVALISDAGTPLISDPGYKLVREAVDAGIAVFAVPGPVAAVAALGVSGLPTDRFFFAGFLPSKSGARRQRLEALSDIDATLVFYESPARLNAVLRDIAEVLGPRHLAVMRELTKRFETHYRGTPRDLLEQVETQQLKGEIVLVIEPPPPAEVTDEMILQQLDVAVSTMSPRDAAREVADVLKVQRKRVYDLMVRWKDRG